MSRSTKKGPFIFFPIIKKIIYNSLNKKFGLKYTPNTQNNLKLLFILQAL